MQLRNAILIISLLFSSQALASEFPTGHLKGIGFTVEKGRMKITDKDMYVYKSSVKITKQSDGNYEFVTVAHLQKSPTTRKKIDKRIDVYEVVWDTPNSGKLINKSVIFKSDNTNFTIKKNDLIIKSWISRNKIWETQTYSLGNK